MKSQATRFDVLEAQQRRARRREMLAWLAVPAAAVYFGYVLTFPLWS